MRTVFPDALSLTFVVCQAIDEQDGVRQSIDLFRQSGGRFIYQGGLEPYDHPESWIWESGTLSCDVRHPDLMPDQMTEFDAKHLGPSALELPRASFVCFPKIGTGLIPVSEWAPVRAIRLRQATGFDDGEVWKLDRVAWGLVRMAGLLYPLFRPRFSYIDESAAGQPTLDVYLRDELPCLFWVNLFGPELVERLGRDFLRTAPGWRLVEFTDGGVMHIATASYWEWWNTDFTDLRDYFRQQLPGIEIYRGESLPELG
jgi:hypothetical protein